MQDLKETWVWCLVQKDPLEKEKAIHASILAWRVGEPVHGVTKSQTWVKWLSMYVCMYLFIYPSIFSIHRSRENLEVYLPICEEGFLWYWGSSYIRWNEHLDGGWQLYPPMTVSSPYTKSAQEWKSHASRSILSSPKAAAPLTSIALHLLFLFLKVLTRVELYSVLYLVLLVQIMSRRLIPDAACLRSSFLLTNELYPIVNMYV